MKMKYPGNENVRSVGRKKKEKGDVVLNNVMNVFGSFWRNSLRSPFYECVPNSIWSMKFYELKWRKPVKN